MLQHGIEWEKKGTHEKHLLVLDVEKKERAKEVAELMQTISDGKVLIAAGQKTSRYEKRAKRSGRKYQNFPLQIFF